MAAPKKQRSLPIRRMRHNLMKLNLDIRNVKMDRTEEGVFYSISHYKGKKKMT